MTELSETAIETEVRNVVREALAAEASRYELKLIHKFQCEIGQIRRNVVNEIAKQIQVRIGSKVKDEPFSVTVTVNPTPHEAPECDGCYYSFAERGKRRNADDTGRDAEG